MIVQAPDGKTIDFGDLPEEEINAAMKGLYPSEESGLYSNIKRDLSNRFKTAVDIYGKKQEGVLSAPEAALGMVGRVGLGGVGDVAGNVIGSGLSGIDKLTGGYAGDALSSMLGGVANVPTGTSERTVGGEAVRGIGSLAERYERFAKENPRTANIAESVGNIAMVAPPLKAAYAPTKAAIQGTGRIAKAGMAAIKKPVILGSKELAQKSGELFKLAEQYGGNLKPKFMDDFVSEVASKAEKDPLVKSLVLKGGGRDAYGDVVEVSKDFLGQPMTFDRAKALDETLGNLAYETADSFGKMSKTGQQYLDMQHTLRNMIDKATPEMFEGGRAGFETAKEAKKHWAAMMRMRDVERVIDNAQYFEQPSTAIKTGMRQLLKRKDSIYRSPAEISAMQDASKTGALTGLLKVFGSGLVPIAAGGAGMATGGIAGGLAAIPAYAVQGMAKRGANALQMGKALRVKEAIAGSVQDTRRPITRSIEELAKRTGKSVKEIMQMNPKYVKKLMGEE